MMRMFIGRRLANIMFSDDTPDAEIKLIDFGLSKVGIELIITISLS